MSTDINNSNKRQNNRAFAGLFLIALGGIYLLRQLDFFFFPSWLFSWPMILIIVGVFSGIKHNFTRPGAYIMILLGSLFLLGRILCMSIHFFWPFILIAIGVSMLLGRNGYWNHERWERKQREYHGGYDDNHVNL